MIDQRMEGDEVAVVWTEMDGVVTVIRSRLSRDGGVTWQERELGRTEGPSEKPRLISNGVELIVIWETRDEGIRVMRTQGDGFANRFARA
jgi:hypothetical protein